MLNVIKWQFVAALVAICIGALMAGVEGALSAALAAFATITPSCWFAVRLTMLARQGKVSPITFLLGEFIKVAATIALLVVVTRLWSGIHWPALLLAVIIVLQASFLAFLKKN
ncbi:MAG: ATP synthase subunit I [Betaproteobacteria bacterium]|nr:ATP synthase subunit I [Betaproteobacteria bacterium]